jgi:hypothetical protein
MTNVNATQFLRDDHRTIRGLFSQFEAVDARAPEMKDGVCREILMKLEIHQKVETELFYPAAMELLDKEGQALVQRSLDEHGALERLLGEIRGMERNDPRLNPSMAELIESVELHVEEEERDLFPLLDRMEGMGGDLTERMESRMQELLSSPEYRDALPEKVQNPNGGEQKRIA